MSPEKHVNHSKPTLSQPDFKAEPEDPAEAIDEKSSVKGGGIFETVLEDTGDERDLRQRQNFHGKTLVWLVYQSIGVIYGDIGTSPLYVYSSTFSSDPSRDDLLGALSLIIWTLTLIVSIKYVLIVLYADDEGEGGTFAVYSLLSRYANIVRRDPREESTIKMERVMTGEMRRSGRKTRTFLETSAVMKTLLKIIGVFGVSLVMSDGVLTPAQSVLGAIQGLRVADESITTPTVIGVSCTILVLLFLIQPFGTSKLGSTFAPIVIVWLLFNVAFAIHNLIKFDASVFKAFSPYFAGLYLQRNRTEGWKSLGGILLCFTGCEALFADLGAFSRNSIQISWLCFGYPCLLLAYIGQAAYISAHPDAYLNPFFNSVPPGMFYPSLVIAVLAAIVASQTMITATFQLLSQIIKLSYFPQIKVIHTSKSFHNQIYIPWVNWLLMIGTVAVTAIYNNTTRLGQAYGVCVILVTFLTTCTVTLVALVVWGLPIFLILPLSLAFALLDGVYLSSALTKIPEGAWFTLALSFLLSSIFILWRFGKENQWRAEREDRIALADLLQEVQVSPPPGQVDISNKTQRTETNTDLDLQSAHTELRLGPSLGSSGPPITRLEGIGIFFDKSGLPPYAPTVFLHFLQKFHAVPQVVIFFTFKPISKPTIPAEERFTVRYCRGAGVPAAAAAAEDNETEIEESPGAAAAAAETTRARSPTAPPLRDFYRVIVRHGYMDERIIAPDLGPRIYEAVHDFIIHSALPITPPSLQTIPETTAAASTTSDLHPPHSRTAHEEETSRRLSALSAASRDQILNIVGKEQLRISDGGGIRGGVGVVRKVVLAAYLWLRGQTGTRVTNMELEAERVVEVGFVKVM